MRYTISDVIGTRDGGGQYLIDAIAANIHRYPGIRAAWAERAAWVLEGRRIGDGSVVEWLDLVDIRLTELVILEPNPEWDTGYCGI
jgi:hypothetical protein